MQGPPSYLPVLLALALFTIGTSGASGAGETRSALLMGQELSGLGSGFHFSQTELSGDLSCNAGSSETRAESRLDLPDGARITAWQAWVGDDLTEGDLALELIERCRSATDPASVEIRQLGSLATSGTPSDTVLAQTLAMPATVDASTCTYAVRAEFGVGTGGCSGFNRRVYQVRADYLSGAPQAPYGISSLDGTALEREQYENLFATTPQAERYCVSGSSGGYFTTRMPLPDRAVLLAAYAWMHDEDPLWDADARFRLMCRGKDSKPTWRDLAVLQTTGNSGASFFFTEPTDASPVDQRECAVLALTASNRGDPCVSEHVRHGRVSLAYVIDPVFADGLDALAPMAGGDR